MVHKKITLIILIIIVIFASSGCWDALDINDKDNITAVAIDSKNEIFHFYLEIPNLSVSQQGSTGEEGGSGKYSIVHGKGKTFAEARQSLDNKLDKYNFPGTVRTLVLTNDMTKYGIDEYLFRLQSENDYRKAVGIVTTFEKVEDLLAVQSENNVSVGYAIEETINTLEKSGKAIQSTTSEILEWLYSKNVCFTIPNVDIEDQNLALTGYSIIYDGKFQGFLSAEESKGLVWFLNPQAEWIYVVPFGENQATVKVQLKKRTIKPFYSEGEIVLNTKFEFKSTVKYLDEDISFDEEISSKVNRILQKMLIDDLFNTVSQSKYKFRCEYLGFDDAFRIAYPNDYEKMDWNEEYLNAKIRISVENSLDPGGTMDFNAPVK